MWLCCCDPETPPDFTYVDVGKIGSDRSDTWRIMSDEYDVSATRTGLVRKGLLATYNGGVYLFSTRTVSEHGEATENQVYLYRYNSSGNLVWKRKLESADNWDIDKGLGGTAGGGNEGAELKQACVDSSGVLYLCHGKNEYIWDEATTTTDMGDDVGSATAATVSAYDPSDGSILWATGGGPINAIAESGGTLYCFDYTQPGTAGTDYHFIELDTSDGSVNTLGTSGSPPDNSGDSNIVHALIDPGNKVWYRRSIWGTGSAFGASATWVVASVAWDTYAHEDIWTYSDFGIYDSERPNGFWFDGDGDVFFTNGAEGGGGFLGSDRPKADKIYGNRVSADPVKEQFLGIMGLSSNVYFPGSHFGSEAVIAGASDGVGGYDEAKKNVWWPDTDEFIDWPQATINAPATPGAANTVLSDSSGNTFVMTTPIHELA